MVLLRSKMVLSQLLHLDRELTPSGQTALAPHHPSPVSSSTSVGNDSGQEALSLYSLPWQTPHPCSLVWRRPQWSWGSHTGSAWASAWLGWTRSCRCWSMEQNSTAGVSLICCLPERSPHNQGSPTMPAYISQPSQWESLSQWPRQPPASPRRVPGRGERCPGANGSTVGSLNCLQNNLEKERYEYMILEEISVQQDRHE